MVRRFRAFRFELCLLSPIIRIGNETRRGCCETPGVAGARERKSQRNQALSGFPFARLLGFRFDAFGGYEVDSVKPELFRAIPGAEFQLEIPAAWRHVELLGSACRP